jgi:hypothetical protein
MVTIYFPGRTPNFVGKETIVKRFRLEFASSLVTLVGCVAVLTVVPSAQAQNQALLGKWNMVATAPDNDVPWTLTIGYKNGKYEAVSGTGDSTAPVKDLRVDGNTLHFTVDYQGSEYDIDLKLQGDALTGTWSGQGNSGETKGHKAA